MKLKVVNVNLFKAIFGCITRFTDTCHFEISKNGVRIRSVDPHDFCYVDIKLSPSFFDDFSWKTEKFSSGADIGKFKYVLANISNNKPLYVDIKNNGITLHLENGGSTNYKLEWLDEDDNDLPEPIKLNYSAEVSIPSTDFFTIVKEVAAVSREICFGIEDHKFTITASEPGFSYSKEIDLRHKLSLVSSSYSDSPVQTWAIIDYLKTLNEIVTLCGEVKLSLKEDLPLRLDLSYRGRGSFTFLIANRKLTDQQVAGRKHRHIRKTSPFLQTSSLPQISVTKFPQFMSSLNAKDGMLEDELKHSAYETSDRDYYRLASWLQFILKKNKRIFLTKEGQNFVENCLSKKRSTKSKLNAHVKKTLPEYSKLLEILSQSPKTAEDVMSQFTFSKQNNSVITKKEDVLLLLGIATWCNAIDRKLGPYYYEK